MESMKTQESESVITARIKAEFKDKGKEPPVDSTGKVILK